MGGHWWGTLGDGEGRHCGELAAATRQGRDGADPAAADDIEAGSVSGSDPGDPIPSCNDAPLPPEAPGGPARKPRPAAPEFRTEGRCNVAACPGRGPGGRPA